MKKSIITMAMVLGVSFAAYANGTGAYTPPPAGPMSGDYVVGGFEASGHMFVGAGWQRVKANNTLAAATGSTVLPDINRTVPGVIGNYANTNGNFLGINREDTFQFFVDEVELDLAKTFGENIRVRTDLDFGSATLNSGPRFATRGTGVDIEQAYITANIPVGNGMELLVGRFNAPVGFESNDVINNDTISRSIIYRALRSHTFTGAKLWYAFSDAFDWSLWVANNGLNHDTSDVVFVNTDIPSLGTRFNLSWGDEGAQSHIGLSGAWGQDHAGAPVAAPAAATSGRKNGWSFFGDLDWLWNATDNFALGGEAIYRQIDTTTTVAGGVNGKYIGGLLNLHYDFSDVWDGTLKYGYAHDINGANVAANTGILVTPLNGGAVTTLTGVATGGVTGQQYHEMVLAGNYAITDGAKLRLEGGYTLVLPAGVANRQHVFGFGGGFAYEF